MRLHEQMAHTGALLFRWRSYVLLAFVPLMIWAMTGGAQIELAFGPTVSCLYSALCILFVIAGETVRIMTVAFVDPGTSGRNVKQQVATELNTTGIYSQMRNPLYFGNCLMYLGVVLFAQSIVLGLFLALVLLPYYERIIAAEEEFLSAKFGDPYDKWCQHTPAFLPRLKGWVRPARGLSMRILIRREYTSAYAAVLSLYLVNLGLARLGPQVIPVAPLWHAVLFAATLTALAIFFIKSRTALLQSR